MNSKISVIIPVYNAEKYLNECVDSIINQTVKDIEIILIDDESPDGCGAICDEYASKYDNVRVIHQKNHGINGTRKVGVQQAIGEWIAFCDDDDSMPCNALELMYSQTPDTDMVIGFPDKPMHTKELSLEECRQSILGDAKFPPTPWAKLFRRSILTDDMFEFPREIDGEEDMIMNTRILFSINRAPHFVFEKVYSFRRNTLSVSHTKKASLAHEIAFHNAHIAAVPEELRPNYMKQLISCRLNGLFGVAGGEPESLQWKTNPFLIQLKQDIVDYKYKLNLQEYLLTHISNARLLKALSFGVKVENFIIYRLGLNN